MEWLRELLINVVVTTAFIAVTALLGRAVYRRWRRSTLCDLLKRHFSPVRLDELAVSDRQFPFHVRVDLHLAVMESDVPGHREDFHLLIHIDLFVVLARPVEIAERGG